MRHGMHVSSVRRGRLNEAHPHTRRAAGHVKSGTRDVAKQHDQTSNSENPRPACREIEAFPRVRLSKTFFVLSSYLRSHLCRLLKYPGTMQQSLVAQQQLAVLSGRSVTRRPVVSRPRHVVRMAKEDEKPETSSGTDSYAKIEAPVRDTIPDGARPVSTSFPRY